MKNKRMKWFQSLSNSGRNLNGLKGVAVAFLLLTVMTIFMASAQLPAQLPAQLSKPNPQTKTQTELRERWAFTIENYPIEHQGKAIADIKVSYDYVDGIGVPDPSKYPDFVPISNFIKNFIVNYPNEKDFWEILNKNLVTALLTQPIPTPYGVQYKLNELLNSITIRLDVQSGAADVKMSRSSIVTGFSRDLK
ncbi:hypothetical protein ACKFKG_09900 [Phormidesmis sp. 146-35]